MPITSSAESRALSAAVWVGFMCGIILTQGNIHYKLISQIAVLSARALGFNCANVSACVLLPHSLRKLSLGRFTLRRMILRQKALVYELLRGSDRYRRHGLCGKI
ncbi:seizure 6-like protein [Tachysurus ichikawai]